MKSSLSVWGNARTKARMKAQSMRLQYNKGNAQSMRSQYNQWLIKKNAQTMRSQYNQWLKREILKSYGRIMTNDALSKTLSSRGSDCFPLFLFNAFFAGQHDILPWRTWRFARPIWHLAGMTIDQPMCLSRCRRDDGNWEIVDPLIEIYDGDRQFSSKTDRLTRECFSYLVSVCYSKPCKGGRGWLT